MPSILFTDDNFDIEEIKKSLISVQSKLNNDLTTLESQSPNCSQPIQFDIGINETFLELDDPDDNEKFYRSPELSPQNLLVIRAILGLLGRWDIVESSCDNIKSFFRNTIGNNISSFIFTLDEYFLKKIKGHQLDFNGENILRLKLLLSEFPSCEQVNSKQSEIIETLYLSIVEPAMKIIGIGRMAEPYYAWLELKYQTETIEEILDTLNG